jgi:hypothetical protein
MPRLCELNDRIIRIDIGSLNKTISGTGGADAAIIHTVHGPCIYCISAWIRCTGEVIEKDGIRTAKNRIIDAESCNRCRVYANGIFGCIRMAIIVSY